MDPDEGLFDRVAELVGIPPDLLKPKPISSGDEILSTRRIRRTLPKKDPEMG